VTENPASHDSASHDSASHDSASHDSASHDSASHDLGPRALSLYDHAPKRDRLHVRGRFRTCPVAVVDAEVPRRGRVLEVGCGHGLISAYMALSSSDRQVSGIDIDARKIAVASHALSHIDPASAHLEFHHAAAGELPDRDWDAIVIVDVLYLLDRPAEFALLDDCVERLSEHGVLVVKETDVAPRWKHRLAKTQEIVATKILRITAGSSLSFTPVAEIADHLRSLGLEVATRRVDKGYLHPHALVVARRGRPADQRSEP
jgi:2-polyprenyl-3-methyl-5-hydroxy-6-metoxy-1,4-benzoquinol methylase